MVNWRERLARETPFLDERLRAAGARRLLDVGSATGHHAAHLAGLGYAVVGVDPSAAMVERARALTAGRQGVEFVQAGFGGLRTSVAEDLDAVLCLGNTLPHVGSQEGLLAALADIAAVLRPGGLLILQQLNYDRILARRQRFLGQTAGATAEREFLFFRFYDYADAGLTFNMLIQQRPKGGAWEWRLESTRLYPVLSSHLAEALSRTGFDAGQTFGNYAADRFDPLESNDLIVVARKAG
jgi:glycine/sarcosine N-methyltransferase/sarcosine/dimethylglycine N-methyltransferase